MQNTSDLFNSLLHGGYASQGGQQLFTPYRELHVIENKHSSNNLMMAAYYYSGYKQVKLMHPHNWMMICNMVACEIFVDRINALPRTATCQEGFYSQIFVISRASSLFP